MLLFWSAFRFFRLLVIIITPMFAWCCCMSSPSTIVPFVLWFCFAVYFSVNFLMLDAHFSQSNVNASEWMQLEMSATLLAWLAVVEESKKRRKWQRANAEEVRERDRGLRWSGRLLDDDEHFFAFILLHRYCFPLSLSSLLSHLFIPQLCHFLASIMFLFRCLFSQTYRRCFMIGRRILISFW